MSRFIRERLERLWLFGFRVCERNTRERNRAPLLCLTTQLVFDYSCEPTVELGSEAARGSAGVHRRLSSRTWSDSVLCFLC